MQDLPQLAPEAWARIELAKLQAGDELRYSLSDIRSHAYEPANYETDFLIPLSFAYADFVADIYYAHVSELLRIHKDPSNVVGFLNTIFDSVVAFALPMWTQSGGKPEYRHLFVDTAYRVIKASDRYRSLMALIASSTGENAEIAPAKCDNVGEAGSGCHEGDSQTMPADIEGLQRAEHESTSFCAKSEPVGMSSSETKPVTIPLRKKRGRPTSIPDELKLQALQVRGAKARAKILYGTLYPTQQQVKNVRAILRHFERKDRRSE